MTPNTAPTTTPMVAPLDSLEAAAGMKLAVGVMDAEGLGVLVPEGVMEMVGDGVSAWCPKLQGGKRGRRKY